MGSGDEDRGKRCPDISALRGEKGFFRPSPLEFCFAFVDGGLWIQGGGGWAEMLGNES